MFRLWSRRRKQFKADKFVNKKSEKIGSTRAIVVIIHIEYLFGVARESFSVNPRSVRLVNGSIESTWVMRDIAMMELFPHFDRFGFGRRVQWNMQRRQVISVSLAWSFWQSFNWSWKTITKGFIHHWALPCLNWLFEKVEVVWRAFAWGEMHMSIMEMLQLRELIIVDCNYRTFTIVTFGDILTALFKMLDEKP